MSNLTIRFNGQGIKGVTGISYLEGISKFKIITKLDDKLVSDNYDVDSVVIELIGNKVDYKVPVGCVYRASDYEFTGVVGRYGCISIKADGIVKILDNDFHWIELKIDRGDVDYVRDIAGIGLGSLYVEINSDGLGKIYNRSIDEDVE